MSAQRYLFPDRREDMGNAFDGQGVVNAWHVPLDDVLSRLRQIDWAYPALFIYREADENRWSQVTFGLSLKPELGEA
jgi:hypothetical protein